MLADEPTGNLDTTAAADVLGLLRTLTARDCAVVVVTHELASAFLIADRMMLIDKGNIEAYGTPDEMRSSTQPRVRQFLDRVAEPEVSQEMDYLQMLTESHHGAGSASGRRRNV